MDWARARREAIRKQAELRRRLTAAEQALDDGPARPASAPAPWCSDSGGWANWVTGSTGCPR
ncbi:MAG TPA: hypothetical protein VFJ07_10300 [Streptosporangiaceae bacterium]|nr:hypothetical protein [Streptosporangiaceae bacterium]